MRFPPIGAFAALPIPKVFLTLGLGALGACRQPVAREACAVWPRPESRYPVVRVVDGDTLWIRRFGKVEKLRVLSVDTEERPRGTTPGAPGRRRNRKRATAYGEETALWAQRFFADLADGSDPPSIGLIFPGAIPERDTFGRLLCHVVLPNGDDYGLLLVENGRSPYFTKYGRSTLLDREFREAEKRARQRGLGLWSEGSLPALDYTRLQAWWRARAAAVDAFRTRRTRGVRILSAEDGPGLEAAGADHAGNPEQPGSRITVFGEIDRFFEESDGSLTVRFRGSSRSTALRARLPLDLRYGDLERDLRASLDEYRQNYWFLTGALLHGPRGLVLPVESVSDWHLAGPEPKMATPLRPVPRSSKNRSRNPPMDKEIEFKFAVEDASVFDKLIRHLDLPAREFHASDHQVNHFFDTRSLALHANRVVLRLREEGGRHLLTLKGKEEPRSQDGTAVERMELEVQLAPGAALDVLQGSISPRDALAQRVGDRNPEGLAILDEALGKSELHYFGRFENLRTRLSPIKLQVGTGSVEVVFELDTTTFAPGKVEFEIEVEIEASTDLEATRQSLIQLFKEAGVAWSPAESKARRFFAITMR